MRVFSETQVFVESRVQQDDIIAFEFFEPIPLLGRRASLLILTLSD